MAKPAGSARQTCRSPLEVRIVVPGLPVARTDPFAASMSGSAPRGQPCYGLRTSVTQLPPRGALRLGV
jgi:hypothetical protein